jgi:hypothetical protein
VHLGKRQGSEVHGFAGYFCLFVCGKGVLARGPLPEALHEPADEQGR